MPKQIRPIRIEGNIAYVMLTRGYEAIIDAADAPLVDGFNWSASVIRNAVYGVRYRPCSGKQGREGLLLHRVIMCPPHHLMVDHRDGNGLNNRRENLRTATRGQNAMNARARSDSVSGHKGVCWCAREGKWGVKIAVDKRRISLGYFDFIEDAAKAYAAASVKYHGDFGRT